MSILMILGILAVGVIAFFATAEALYGPRPVKPKPVTMADVWASIASAQKTVDDSLDMVRGAPMSRATDHRR